MLLDSSRVWIGCCNSSALFEFSKYTIAFRPLARVIGKDEGTKALVEIGVIKTMVVRDGEFAMRLSVASSLRGSLHTKAILSRERGKDSASTTTSG